MSSSDDYERIGTEADDEAGLEVVGSRDGGGGDTGTGSKAGLTITGSRGDDGGDTPPDPKVGLASRARKAGSDESASG